MPLYNSNLRDRRVISLGELREDRNRTYSLTNYYEGRFKTHPGAGSLCCGPYLSGSLSVAPRFTMNTLRRLSVSKPKGARHTIVVSRAGGSIGLGLSDDNCVTSIAQGGSAASCDVMIGDRIVGVSGKRVSSRKVVSVLAENTGDDIELEIERRALTTERKASMSRLGSTFITPRAPSRFSISALTGSHNQRFSRSESGVACRTGSFAASGETVITLRLVREAEESWGLEVDEMNTVTAVMSDSLASRAGFVVGDIVTKVGGAYQPSLRP